MKFKHINSASSGIKKQTNILTYIVFLILADLDKIKFKNPDRYKQLKKKKRHSTFVSRSAWNQRFDTMPDVWYCKVNFINFNKNDKIMTDMTVTKPCFLQFKQIIRLYNRTQNT